MAAKMNVKKRVEAFYRDKPDVQLTMVLDDDAEHTWTVKNGGAFLSSEYQRFALEMMEMSKITDKVHDESPEQTREITDRYDAIRTRFVSAFKGQVQSEDGSSDAWIDETINNASVLTLIMNGMMSILNGGTGDD